VSFAEHHTRIKLSTVILLFGRKSVPLHRNLIVLGNTLSFSVHQTQIGLSRGIPLFGSKSPPLHRSLMVLWNALSFAVHKTEIGLGRGIPCSARGSHSRRAVAKSPLLYAVRPFWKSAENAGFPTNRVRSRTGRMSSRFIRGSVGPNGGRDG